MKHSLSVLSFVLVLALALMVCSTASADTFQVHENYSTTISLSSRWLIVDSVSVDDASIVSASISGHSITITTSGMAYVTTVDVTGLKPGTTVVRYYDEDGDFLSSSTIVVDGHIRGNEQVDWEPTCTEKGMKSCVCTVCGDVLGEEIPTIDHDDGAWRTVKEPTCTEAGTKERHCTMCDLLLETETIPATGHDDGAWKTVTEADCTSDGTKELHCTKCDAKLDTAAIPATGHTAGEWETTTKATCNKDGLKEKKCTVCQAVLESETIPSAGAEHAPADWQTTKEPTCVAAGEQQKVCTVCGEVVASEELPALGHTAGEMTQTKEPTCTETGLKEQHCTVCGELLASEEVPANGHTAGEWVVVKKATKEETGEKQQACTVCGQVLQTEEIPVVTRTIYLPVACSIGPRFRDETDLTDEWDMFSAIDISQDGVQEYELIAGNIHIVGTVKVVVENGTVTVTYDVLKGVTVKSEFMTVLPSLSAVQSLNREEMTAYTFGQPISIADDLNGDTQVLLYIHNELSYCSDIEGLKRLYHTSDMYKDCVQAMKAIMD